MTHPTDEATSALIRAEVAELLDARLGATISAARRVIRPLSLRATERGRESKILDAEPISGVWRVELNARIVADAPAQAILYRDPVRQRASEVPPPRAFCYVVQDDLDLDTIRAAGVEVSE